MTLTPGEILHDRYKIEGIIGKGGMGAVYRGEDTVLLVPVAIKENLNPLPQAVRQFKREALLLASLRHPHLPRVTDHFVHGDLQYLIMDYVAGDDLKKILERDGAIDEKQVLEWTKEIVAALAFLHRQHPPVVHRDIKPANIKITPEGKPVLVDFGIAKAAEAGGVTTTGARSLTPGFAPPEQYGSSPTDSRSDQYSLAATIFNLLTGTIPPDSLDRTLGQAVLTSARELNPKISLTVDRALWKAMGLSPSERFADIEDFLAALEGKLEIPEPVTISLEPPTQIRRVPEKATQEQILQAEQAPPVEPLPAEPQPGPARPLLLLGAIGGGVFVFAAVVGITLLLLRGGIPAPAKTTPTTAASSPSAAVRPSATTALAAVLPTSPPTVRPSATVTRTPSPSPTPVGGSRLLAFVSNRSEDKRYQIYALDLSSREVRQLTNDSAEKGRMAWSPDGQQIFFESRAKGGKWEIYRMNADGTGAVNLTNNDADDWFPAVALRGNLVAFVSGRIVGYFHVYMMNFDGSNVIDISAQHKNKGFNMPNEYDPGWSPDGRFLYIVLSPAGKLRIYRWDIQIPSLDPVIVTIFNGDYKEGEPAVSPLGNLVAYTRYIGSETEICISETDLTKRRPCDQSVSGRGYNFNPAWSPDANWLAFTSRRTGNNEIYLMTVSGASVTNLTDNPADDKYPAWQPIINSP